MRARYTQSAARELDAGVTFLREHAPAVAGALPAPSSAQLLNSWSILIRPSKPKSPESVASTSGDFAMPSSITVDTEADVLVILHIRHAARQWPWTERQDSD